RSQTTPSPESCPLSLHAALPIYVLHRLAVGRAPVAPLPLRQPFRDALADVLGVCVERHCARTLERGERADRSGELHAIVRGQGRSEEHTSELQSRENLVCRLLLE